MLESLMARPAGILISWNGSNKDQMQYNSLDLFLFVAEMGNSPLFKKLQSLYQFRRIWCATVCCGHRVHPVPPSTQTQTDRQTAPTDSDSELECSLASSFSKFRRVGANTGFSGKNHGLLSLERANHDAGWQSWQYDNPRWIFVAKITTFRICSPVPCRRLSSWKDDHPCSSLVKFCPDVRDSGLKEIYLRSGLSVKLSDPAAGTNPIFHNTSHGFDSPSISRGIYLFLCIEQCRYQGNAISRHSC